MVSAYKKMWSRWSDFSGRSSLSDYWWVVLANMIIIFALLALGAIVAIIAEPYFSNENTLSSIVSAPYIIYSLAVLIPGLALLIRRLHDTGKSGWWVLISFVPFGWIVLLIFILQTSTPEANQWGNPNQ